MELKLYNTLTREKQVFKPIDPKNVRMYVCGPTVYDFAHIGNARPVIVFDVLFRLLRHLYGEDHVTYVRNITDVEDKINARALRDFGGDIAAGRMSLNDAIRHVTEKTANQFHADVKALGCLEPTHEPRATQHIGGMVKMIQALIDKGHAYVAAGVEGREVLFSVGSMPDYGQLSKRKLEDQQAGARVAVEAHKKNPADFVLWKESSADQPGWEGDFTEAGTHHHIHGRPGWHIECSVMAEHHLGRTFDIHGGGLDLIFPHHENEIAQSRCAHGTDAMANVWMHNEFLRLEDAKMSKSEGNFITINELLNTEKFGGRRWPGEVLRLAMLMTHYREPINFSLRRLEEAEAVLARWKDSMRDNHLSFQEGNRQYYKALKVSPDCVAALCDDLGFSKVVTELHRLSDSRDISDAQMLFATMNWLGLTNFDGMRKWEEYSEATAVGDYMNVGMLKEKIDSRLAFIRDKNFAEADRIRDELLAQGIQLKDGKDPETGDRVTSWELKR